jgi:hypothetical protein
MKFSIHLAGSDLENYWETLQSKKADGTISEREEIVRKKWGQAMAHLSQDPRFPGLRTHEIGPLSKRYGRKVFQSYLENNNSRAMRMYWVYGPNNGEITIVGLEPHPEDDKNGGYDKVKLY